jgi:hypothetical protein
MGNLLIGVAVAWLGFSERGQKLTRKIMDEMKQKYSVKEKTAKGKSNLGEKEGVSENAQD